MSNKGKKSSKGLVIAIIVLAVVVLAGGVLAMTGAFDKKVAQETPVAEEPAPEPEPIINPITGYESDTPLPARPMIVSIDNVGDAVPQSNISQADIIYEFPVEGLQTRLEVLFYTDFPEFVGPCRSTRPYFVDLAREYKALFTAYGWSPDAKRYLKKNYVPWINGMVDTDMFYRVKDKAAPHNAYITWDEIKARIDSEGWWDEQQEIEPFHFRDEEWQAAQEEKKAAAKAAEEAAAASEDANAEATAEEGEGAEAQPAAEYKEPEKVKKVTFKYSYAGCEFTYDSETGDYGRTKYGETSIDKETGEQLKVQNVLVQCVHSEIMTDENGIPDHKGRLNIDMCAGGDAYLYTDGEVIKGTWSRQGLDSRTIFVDEEGNDFALSQGKTWVQVMDQNCKMTTEAPSEE